MKPEAIMFKCHSWSFRLMYDKSHLVSKWQKKNKAKKHFQHFFFWQRSQNFGSSWFDLWAELSQLELLRRFSSFPSTSDFKKLQDRTCQINKSKKIWISLCYSVWSFWFLEFTPMVVAEMSDGVRSSNTKVLKCYLELLTFKRVSLLGSRTSLSLPWQPWLRRSTPSSKPCPSETSTTQTGLLSPPMTLRLPSHLAFSLCHDDDRRYEA